MRFLTAPWKGLLADGVWLKNAAHANRCAALLESQLNTIPELEIQMPVEANAVFVKMPPRLIHALHDQGWHFYNFIGEDGVRLMCSWNTKEEDVNVFVGDIKKNLTTLS
jgi:threonine aldolase